MFKRFTVKSTFIALVCAASLACAIADTPKEINVPAGDLATALEMLQKQTAVELVFRPEEVKGFRTKGLKGTFEVRDAVRQLLKGTPLQLRIDSSGPMLIALPRAKTQSDEGVSPRTGGGSVDATDPAHRNSQDSSSNLEEIVVTATKRAEKLHDVAMSVTAVKGDDLTRRHDAGLADLVSQVPGLSIEQLQPGANRVILRGLNSGGSGATVATTVDDIPFFRSSGQTFGAGLFTADVDTYDLQRIEVLRGPQGTLYGAAAEGGLIKYVTNLPDLHAFAGSASLGGESVAGGQTGGVFKGLVNVPFWNNKAALRISAVQQSLPGWIGNPVTAQRNVNHGDKYSLRGSLLIEPTEGLTVRLTAFDQGIRVDGDNSIDVAGAALNPTNPPANQLDPVNGLNHGSYWPFTNHNHLMYYALNVQYDLDWASLLSATSYGLLSNNSNVDISNINAAPNFTLSDIFAGVYGQPPVVAFYRHDFLHKTNQELRLTSNPGTTIFGHAVDWLVGGYFSRETAGFTTTADARSRTDISTILQPAGGSSVTTADYKEAAVFADGTYHFSDAFDVEVGARQAYVKQDSHNLYHCCVFFGPDTAFPVVAESESSHTWSVAPRWHIGPDTLAYLRYATGYRPGGPNQALPGIIPPSYGPDSTRNYEVGLRTSWFDKQLTVDVAVFDIEWKNIQIIGLVNTPTGPQGFIGNSGSARSRGAEWNFLWRPVRGLDIGFLGSYTDAKLTVDAPGIGGKAGDNLSYVPKLSGTVNVDYRWRAFKDYSAFVGTSWSYTDAQYGDFAAPNPVIESHPKLPDYNTTKMQIGLDNGRYSIQLYGNNLTNRHAVVAYQNSGGMNQTGNAMIIWPRTLGLALEARF